MKHIFLSATLALIGSCNQVVHHNMIDNLWKIRKVEILKNSELKKVIDTGYQFWSFKKKSTIEIFDAGKIQNVLHVRIGNSIIRSYDVKGDLQDVFVISEIGDDNLALSSKKKLDDAEYNIVYYLDKVKDSTSGKIPAFH